MKTSRAVIAGAAALAAALALQLFHPAAAQAPAANPALLTKHLVAIAGGRRLNMVCIGEGAPALVFESGANGDILDWQKVQPSASALTTACFTDRAGYGFSDPAARPMTAENVTDDLHALLHAAGIGPVVLVGHALGGLYATLYADRFASEVAGLVLVDPSFAGQHLWGRSASQIGHDTAAFDGSLATLSECAELAREGNLSQAAPHGCFHLAPGRPQAETAWLMAQVLKPSRYESALSEERNFFWYGAKSDTEDGNEEQGALASFGDRPVIVLTAGVPPVFPGETPQTQRQFALDWKAGHDRLAARSSRGESFIVPAATHAIAQDRPDAVIDAIRTVVLEARGRH
jgi:pimeloyl-ACP methyl ester carboxylesterase